MSKPLSSTTTTNTTQYIYSNDFINLTTNMSATTTTIHQHAATFLWEIISQPNIRHHLFTVFLRKNPTKPLKFASQTLENSISNPSSINRSSSLRLARNILLATPETCPFSSFLLSLIYHLTNRSTDACISLLDVFYKDPSFCRLEFSPFLFQELFLLHLSPLIEWYNRERSNVLSSSSVTTSRSRDDNAAADDEEDDQSVAFSTMKMMSGDQAAELKDLERAYEELMNENCRLLAAYFKDLLMNRDDGDYNPPAIILKKSSENFERLSNYRNEEKLESQEFESTNRRYNPMCDEGDISVELNNINGRRKTLTKLPSLFPERVSPRFLITDQASSNERLETSPDFSLSSCYNSSDSDVAEQGTENIETLFALLDSRTSQHQKQKRKPMSEESSCSLKSFMDDELDQNPPGLGKQTPPKDFVCPITTHIFDDPVTLETGQTYERRAIQEWIERGNSTCPITRQNLSSTQLPKTNYVLKRLIAGWQEKNQTQESIERNESEKSDAKSVSPVSVIRQATIDGTMSELRLAITELCTSEILNEAEVAVLKIEQFLHDANTENLIKSMLTKPPVINSFVEILFNSVDMQVLRTTIFILTELGSRDESVIQTLTRVDSDVECIVELFKKGLYEAVVLMYLLRPSALTLSDMDLVDSLLEMITNYEDDDESPKMCVKLKIAAISLVGNILKSCNEENLIECVRGIVSTKAIEKIIQSLHSELIDERLAAVSVLLSCILEEGKCRNIIAAKVDLTRMLESFVEVNAEERFEVVHFLFELAKLNRRYSNDEILQVLRDEGTFSTKHSLLIYLQNAHQDHAPIVAGLLLQLDLLDEPRKTSIYREEAIDTLVSCLRNTQFPLAQISAAETILSLQGRFSYSGKSLSRAILLKRAGLDSSYKAFMRKDQRHHNVFADSEDRLEDEKSAEEWERKVASVLVSHEFGLIFEALAEGLKRSKDEDLHTLCFMAATWLVYMLSVLPDTGIKGAARVCLLKHFVSIFKSRKNVEDRALSMLALNTFIHDPEGLQDLAADMKDVLRGLREFKKSSAMAFQMLKVFSEEHDKSSDIWNHKEISQDDCSVNGEIYAITCSNGKIFSGHSDGTVKVWRSVGTRLHLVQDIREHTKQVTSLAMLHSSGKLYSGSLDKTIRVFSVAEDAIHCEQVHEMKDQINILVIANSTACYIPQGAGVKVYSWNGSSKHVNQNKYVKCLALSQGKLYCGCHDNSIQEVDLATGTQANIQTGHKKLLGKGYPIYAIQVLDGLIYATSPSFDGANVIKIWSASNYDLVGSITTALEVRAIAVGSELIYLGGKSGIVEVWCKKKFNRVETLQAGSNGKILCMALDENEVMLVIGTADGRIQTWGLN